MCVSVHYLEMTSVCSCLSGTLPINVDHSSSQNPPQCQVLIHCVELLERAVVFLKGAIIKQRFALCNRKKVKINEAVL